MPPPPSVRRNDLDKYCGIWSAEEADEFDRLLAEQRQIEGPSQLALEIHDV